MRGLKGDVLQVARAVKSTSIRLREDQIEWAEENHVNLGSLLRATIDEEMGPLCEMCDAHNGDIQTVPIDVATELGYSEPFEACRECRQSIKDDMRGEA